MGQDSQKLNPKVSEVEIGIRDLRIIKIYPLSLASQFEVGDIISKAFADYAEKVQSDSQYESASLVMGIIRDNFATILDMVTDKDISAKDLFQEMTNDQAVAIIEIIYVNNFEDSLKNLRSLFDRARTVFQSKRQSPSSSNDIQDTPSSTSTDTPIQKEESPGDS